MAKRKITIIVVMLCVSLIVASVVLAKENTVPESGHFRTTADEKQLEMLNRMYNTDISFGRLIEAVFPDALKHIPERELEVMRNTGVLWPDQDTPASSETTVTTCNSSRS